MTVLWQLALSGNPGDAATPANTGFDSIVGTACSLATVAGKLAFKVTSPAAVAYGVKNLSNLTDFYYAVDLYYDAANTTGSKRFLQLMDSAVAQALALALSSAAAGVPARPVARNAANTATTLGAQATANFPLSQWMRVEVHPVIAGASGTIQVRLYTNDTDTTVFYDSGVVTAFSDGANVATARLGMEDAPGVDIAFKNARIGDSAGGWLGAAPPASAAAAASATVTFTGAAAGTVPGTGAAATLTFTGTTGPKATAAASATVTFTGTLPVDTPITRWLALPRNDRNIAHRGGENDFPEMTMQAYAAACAQSSKLALNVDGWLSSDGVLVASHDQSTLAVTGVDMDIPTTTWATLQTLRTTNGNQPLCRVKDVLDVYGASRVIFIENKQGTPARTAFNTLLASYPTAQSNFVWKTYYQGTGGRDAAKAAGAVGAAWGYWFAADTAALTTAAAAGWDILGEAYDAPASPDWAQILSIAAGRVVVAHTVTSIANQTQAYASGAMGLMTGKILGVVPSDQSAGSATVTFTGAVGAAARPTAAATVTFTGAAGARAAAAATATVTWTGVASSTAVRAAAASATVTFTGAASAGNGSTLAGNLFVRLAGTWVSAQVYRRVAGAWVLQTAAKL